MYRFGSHLLLGILSFVFVLYAAHPEASSYNDGSRLATVQAIGERGTFVIDDTIFVGPPADGSYKPNPYDEAYGNLANHGTLDKVFIRGHYYSDKPPVPNLLLGFAYRVWLLAGGPTATERPDLFCYWCTVLSAGGPFLLAVLGTAGWMRYLGLSLFWQLALAVSIGYCTVAAVYTQYVNGHIQLLGLTVLVCWLMSTINTESRTGQLMLLGAITGMAYTVELGIGPLLLGGVVLYVFLVTSKWRSTLIVLAAAMPCVLVHHIINYAIGYTLVPLGSVMEYLDFPGSAFGPHNATGTWKHSTAYDFLDYGFGLLVSDCGFLWFQPTIWIAIIAAPLLFFVRGSKQRIALAFCCGWPFLSWLLYTATSNNYAGSCLTIRWFLPLLAPAYWILGILLKQTPRFRFEILWFSIIGGAIMVNVYSDGPWISGSYKAFLTELTVCFVVLVMFWFVRWARRMLSPKKSSPLLHPQ